MQRDTSCMNTHSLFECQSEIVKMNCFGFFLVFQIQKKFKRIYYCFKINSSGLCKAHNKPVIGF